MKQPVEQELCCASVKSFNILHITFCSSITQFHNIGRGFFFSPLLRRSSELLGANKMICFGILIELTTCKIYNAEMEGEKKSRRTEEQTMTISREKYS